MREHCDRQTCRVLSWKNRRTGSLFFLFSCYQQLHQIIFLVQFLIFLFYSVRWRDSWYGQNLRPQHTNKGLRVLQWVVFWRCFLWIRWGCFLFNNFHRDLQLFWYFLYPRCFCSRLWEFLSFLIVFWPFCGKFLFSCLFRLWSSPRYFLVCLFPWGFCSFVWVKWENEWFNLWTLFGKTMIYGF